MSKTMRTVRERYGAHPAHLLAIVAGTALALIAARPLLEERSRDVAGWFVGGALVHDLLLLPAYVGVDAALLALWRRRPGRVPWINFARFPLAVSAVLFLVWSPLITRKAEQYQGATGRSTDPYLGRWLAISAVLAAVSLLCWALRRLRVGRTAAP